MIFCSVRKIVDGIPICRAIRSRLFVRTPFGPLFGKPAETKAGIYFIRSRPKEESAAF